MVKLWPFYALRPLLPTHAKTSYINVFCFMPFSRVNFNDCDVMFFQPIRLTLESIVIQIKRSSHVFVLVPGNSCQASGLGTVVSPVALALQVFVPGLINNLRRRPIWQNICLRRFLGCLHFFQWRHVPCPKFFDEFFLTGVCATEWRFIQDQ